MNNIYGKAPRYTYNAAGERIMKSYGTMEGVYINGAPQGITFHETDNFTLYPASILSVNKNRFTKHRVGFRLHALTPHRILTLVHL